MYITEHNLIFAQEFPDEITWDIDGGTTFGIDPSFAENSVTDEVSLSLSLSLPLSLSSQ